MQSLLPSEIDPTPRVCGHCGVTVLFRILITDTIRTENELEEEGGRCVEVTTFKLLKCINCSNDTFEQIIALEGGDYLPDDESYIHFPPVSKAPPPTKNMPIGVALVYEEASRVLPYSPRASAGLLRLAVQRLCQILGKPGKYLNEDIGKLVADGLSPSVQQALDYVRVIGNNAVHPGTIVFDDNPEMAEKLFNLVNFLVEQMITQPQAIKEIYQSLPQQSLDEIEKRTQKFSKSAKTSK